MLLILIWVWEWMVQAGREEWSVVWQGEGGRLQVLELHHHQSCLMLS
jgi:hypothetical protein